MLKWGGKASYTIRTVLEASPIDVSHGSKDANPVEPSIKPPARAVFSFLSIRVPDQIQIDQLLSASS